VNWKKQRSAGAEWYPKQRPKSCWEAVDGFNFGRFTGGGTESAANHSPRPDSLLTGTLTGKSRGFGLSFTHVADDMLHNSLCLAAQGVAYVPYFPLGGFSQLQLSRLDGVAASLDATPMQVALAWLLHRSSNILLIPGTSSVEHLRENLSAVSLQFAPDVIAELDSIGVAAM
jgi:Aldo/keto reductase family